MKKFLQGFGSVPLGPFFEELNPPEKNGATASNGELGAAGVSYLYLNLFVFVCFVIKTAILLFNIFFLIDPASLFLAVIQCFTNCGARTAGGASSHA